MTDYYSIGQPFRGAFRFLPVEARFDAMHVPVPESGCWLWLGGRRGSGGYGFIKPGGVGKGKLAHRLSWEMRNGPIPDGMFVCHKCDVPSCVNPDHLFLGTHADNMADRSRKGRQSRGASHRAAVYPLPSGEANSNAKLTAAKVAAIRASTESQRVLARRYGVTQAAISSIKTNRTWRTTA